MNQPTEVTEHAAQASTTQPFIAILDEFGYYFGKSNDPLRTRLRDSKVVPDTTYQVEGEQIFVFDKLVTLMGDRHNACKDESEFAALALSLAPEAVVPALEAVEKWGIVPRSYELVDEDQGVIVRHRELDSRLPEIYADKKAAQMALAGILLGEIQPGEGDFVYGGQPMVLCSPFALDNVPPLPLINGLSAASKEPYKILREIGYLDGFSQITKDFFDQVKGMESCWRDASASIKQHAWRQLSELWLRATDFEFERFNDPADGAPDRDETEKAEIRRLYPELSMLSIGSLYGHLDSYMAHVGYENDWTPVREEAFIVFLLGRLASRTAHPDEVMLMGQWMAGALLRGDTLEDAIKIGRAARDRGQAIVTLASRVASVMNFLARDHSNYAQQGNEVRTFNDVIRMARSHNTVSLTATQKESDFQ